MIVGWLHDHRLEGRFGGAQLTNEEVIRAAPDRVEVVRCYPGSVEEADAYVLNNVKWFGQEELERAMGRPYMIFEHDYWDVHQEWQSSWITPVCEEAEAMVFLSPLHRQSFLRVHGVSPKRTFVVPSAIDVEPFWDLGNRDDRAGTVWLGEFQPHKGIVAACRWAAENEPVDFYGWGPFPPAGPNVRIAGCLPYDRVPEVLASCEKFLFLPHWAEPFGRTVAEAVLSGCELVCNANVGALWWGFRTREEWAEGVRTAGAKFWEIFEELF